MKFVFRPLLEGMHRILRYGGGEIQFNYEIDKCKVVYHLSILYSKSDVKIGNNELHQAGFGRRSQFGFHDTKKTQIGTFDNPTMHSSCMTAVESPPGYRYKYCDTLQVFYQNRLYKHDTNILLKIVILLK